MPVLRLLAILIHFSEDDIEYIFLVVDCILVLHVTIPVLKALELGIDHFIGHIHHIARYGNCCQVGKLKIGFHPDLKMEDIVGRVVYVQLTDVDLKRERLCKDIQLILFQIFNQFTVYRAKYFIGEQGRPYIFLISPAGTMPFPKSRDIGFFAVIFECFFKSGEVIVFLR